MTVTQRSIICLFSVFSLTSLSAQTIPIGYDTLAISQEIIIDAGADYCGSSVQTDLTSKFIKGGFITDEIKDASFDKHGAINRLGAITGTGIEYRNFNKKIFKKKDWGFLIKGGYDIFAGMIYSKDLYGLAFYGNDRYMGETIDISGTNMTYMSFQKLGFGLIDAKSKSNVTLNVYNISDRFKGDFRTFEINQDESGDQVEVIMAGEVEMKNNLKFNQGIGFGVDLDFKIPVAWVKDETAFIQFQAKNIGFAYMYEKQKVYSFDTTLIFTGLRFDEIIGDNSLFADTLDLLDTLGIKSSEKNRTVLLPGFIQIGKIVDEHQTKKIQSFFGIRLYPTLIYSPYVFGGLDYKPVKWLRVGVNAAYGGFGKFRGGLYTNLMFKNYSAGFATENIVGFFSKRASGQSLFIRLRCAI